MKLSDTQLVILSTAARREDYAVEFKPDMDPATAQKLIAKLAGAGLVEEVDPPGEFPRWQRQDGTAFALRLTAAGLTAIGVEDSSKVASGPGHVGDAERAQHGKKVRRRNVKPDSADPAPKHPVKRNPKVRNAKPQEAKPRRPARAGSKIDLVKGLMERKRGATIREMMEATNWLSHTTRAVLTGLRRRGFAIKRDAFTDKPTVYRITGTVGKSMRPVGRARAAGSR